jgi:alpha-tubulin suppressor-like RCC1 family protein
MSTLRRLTGVAVTLGMFFALLIAAPAVRGVPAEHATTTAQLVMASRIRKGKIRVILAGTGTYTIKRKAYRKSAHSTRTFRVKPGRYTIKAPGATVTPAKVRVRAGKKVKVRITFATPPSPLPGPTPAPTPTTTPPPELNPDTISAGGSHTCGIDAAGKAWCWGSDQFGQIGDGNDGQADEYAPAAVASSLTFRAITAGASHTCGIDATGKAWCWGSDQFGQIGDGDDGQADEYAPVPVSPDLTMRALSAGEGHTCGIDTTGKAWCWGSDQFGQIGDGNDGQANHYAPAAVASSLTFTLITAGSAQTCALDGPGHAMCWGNDLNGQVGDGNDGQASEYAPVPVAEGRIYVQLTAGGFHTCGLDASGRAWCWGVDNNGQLGDGPDGETDEYAPVAVASTVGFSHMTAGSYHTCGIDASAKAWCWGFDHFGGVGDGNDTQATEYTPVPVAGEHTFATTR